MRACCVPNCPTKKGRRFWIPTEQRIREIWVERINNPKLTLVFKTTGNLENFPICAEHFAKICRDVTGKLLKYSLPTLNMPGYSGDSSKENCFSYPPATNVAIPEKLRDVFKKVGIVDYNARDEAPKVNLTSAELVVTLSKRRYERKGKSQHKLFCGETTSEFVKIEPEASISCGNVDSPNTTSTFYQGDMSQDRKLILGIDIGTTSVKVCVVDVNTNEVLANQTKDTQSNVPSDQGTDGNKQDVPTIISALNTCVAKLPKDLLKRILKIGICGQMHGVMLWNNESDQPAWERIERDGVLVRYDVVHTKVSALYTWQDSRCDIDFIKSLPQSESHLPTYSGYGIATLFWMARHKPEKLQRFNCAGTIQDFAVAMLCNLAEPVTSEQNAASWGYFNCITKKWNDVILEAAAFPVKFLPKVLQSGSFAGSLSDDWHMIPKGIPIGVALGDLQCSVLATIENSYDAVLNISTSAQLAFVCEDYVPNVGAPIPSAVEYFPYFNNKYIAVAASLNGGNALATFVKMLQQWLMEFGFCVPQSKVWERLLLISAEDNAVSDLHIQPTLLGERYNPENTASVNHITVGNVSLGQVFRSLCHGLIQNLHSMMPRDILANANISRIVGNGSGLSRNKVLQKEVQNLYQLPLVFTAGGDAAKGAAMAVTSKD